ncbi:1-deoxypentalenic acid 11-beta-hydroxylase [Pseudovibrio sp. Ad46]|uniref:phytanoyl-CoA dioxygenase family protein n=1 Tax=Pseudovibrio sp. Ad46 TaxID=989432 RepID=UPI0007AE7491|nr:phytanoyl-CoA dioxygenase family protein [Pseudovibrio sp. Ad46]KZK88596.1 1-deoxypentalenic acid 11-beta-hydroxylase [Pseudovibrio sp. Ad46]
MTLIDTANSIDTGTYQKDGFLCPIKVLEKDDAIRMRAELEAIEKLQGHPMDKAQCNKSYLLYDWADELVHHPVILDAVEQLIGPDILCLMTNLFTKEAGSKSYVSMHQDAAYWGVDADDVVTAWVALSPATAQSGVMKVEPGSHKTIRTQVNTYAKDNLLTRGQEIPEEELEPENQIYMELKPGEMSLHHFKLVHGSDANTTNDRRIGFATRYVAAKSNVSADNQSALLVRGQNHTSISMEKRAKDLNPTQRYREHARAMRNLVRSMLLPEKGAGLGERARLFITRQAGVMLTYYRQIKGG